MDRISRALDLARKRVVSTGERKSESSDGNVDYSNIRNVPLDVEWLRHNRILIGVDNVQIVDAYGLLRTRVLQTMRQNNWKTLGITSADPSVGKTVTSINLAISIAMEHNYSVMLVDADLRKPAISNTMGVDFESGLNEYLKSEAELQDVLIHPQIDHLVMLPSSKVESRSSELLSSPKMIRFIEQEKSRYPERIMLFDLPPVQVGDDVVAISDNLDALLLVVEDGKTQSDDLANTTELLQNVNLLGVVLNKTGEQTSTQAYDY